MEMRLNIPIKTAEQVLRENSKVVAGHRHSLFSRHAGSETHPGIDESIFQWIPSSVSEKVCHSARKSTSKSPPEYPAHPALICEISEEKFCATSLNLKDYVAGYPKSLPMMTFYGRFVDKGAYTLLTGKFGFYKKAYRLEALLYALGILWLRPWNFQVMHLGKGWAVMITAVCVFAWRLLHYFYAWYKNIPLNKIVQKEIEQAFSDYIIL